MRGIRVLCRPRLKSGEKDSSRLRLRLGRSQPKAGTQMTNPLPCNQGLGNHPRVQGIVRMLRMKSWLNPRWRSVRPSSKGTRGYLSTRQWKNFST